MNNFVFGLEAILNEKGAEHAIEFAHKQLEAMFAMLPKTKQKQFKEQFRSAVGDCVTVTVKNCLTGKPVQIRWDQVGGPCDPSTERYHSM